MNIVEIINSNKPINKFVSIENLNDWRDVKRLFVMLFNILNCELSLKEEKLDFLIRNEKYIADVNLHIKQYKEHITKINHILNNVTSNLDQLISIIEFVFQKMKESYLYKYKELLSESIKLTESMKHSELS